MSRSQPLLAQIGRDWVGPHWWERQSDQASAVSAPPGQGPRPTDVAHRSWTAVGNLDSPREALVDVRGLVTPWSDGWSLDWWIGAEDRWHLPSREASVRQRLVEASPVVETAMRVPGGDAVHRAYTVRRSSLEGGGELVVVEVENQSKVPVALALAVRPYNPEGLSAVERIEMYGDGETAVTVDEEVALLLPKAASASAASTLQDGDSALTVLAGDATARWPGPVSCDDGLAQAAFVFPLAHGATLRVALPLTREKAPSRRRPARGPAPQPASLPAALPAASDVARGWKSQSERGTRLELPDDRLAEAVEANLRFLLLQHDRDGDTARHRTRFRDRSAMLHALDYYGFHDEVVHAMASLLDLQGRDGSFGQDREWDANGAVLWTLGEHWHLTHDSALVEAVVGPLALGAQWIDRERRRKGRRKGRQSGLYDSDYEDKFWSAAGLRAAAELLEVAGQPDAAADAERHARELWADLERSMVLDAERLGTLAIPAGPGQRIDAGLAGSLVAGWPLGLLAPDDQRIVATLDALRSDFVGADGRAVRCQEGQTGVSPQLTLLLAGGELAAGDRSCLDRLAWLLDAASGTWTWPEVLEPRSAGGSAGSGHHGGTAAELLRFVRRLLVREVDVGLALASVVPEGWLGQGWAVHDAPTAHGLFSYAVRWHGERPALLWDLRPPEPRGGDTPPDGLVTLTAPGLDPAWSTTERRGEALLSPVAPAGPTSGTSAPAREAEGLSFT